MKTSSSLVAAFCCLWLALPAEAADPVVSNVRAAQRPGTKLVDIDHGVADADGDKLTVSVTVSDSGGATYAVSASSFTGDVGAGIASGNNKRIVWEAGKDWPNQNSANMRFKVTATDNLAGPPQEIPGFVWIKPGTFMMGSPSTEQDRELWDSNETQHQVTISRGYWLGKYEVTQREYLTMMGGNPSQFTGDLRRPVEKVYWDESKAYCSRLTQQERAAGRLPAGYEYRPADRSAMGVRLPGRNNDAVQFWR